MATTKLLETLKLSPVPVVPNGGIELTDCFPAWFSAKRINVLGTLQQITESPIVTPAARSGSIAANVLTLTFNGTVAAEKCKAIGLMMSVSVSDNVSKGYLTFSCTWKDTYGVNTSQNFAGNMTGDSIFPWLFAYTNNVITYPHILSLGEVIRAGGLDVVSDLEVNITGPNGTDVTATLLNAKHPEVVEVLNSDLYERLIRFELNKTQNK